jgi:hypothetical protein
MNEIRSRLLGRGNASPLIESKAPSGASAEAGLGSISVARRESRTQDTRGGDRHRLVQTILSTTWNGQSYSAELINLSGGGAMIEAPFQPLLWDRVDLHLGDNGTIEGAACWIKGRRIGLVFAHETQIDCSPELRAGLLSEVIATSFPEVTSGRAPDGPKEPEPEARRAESRHPLIWRGIIHYDFDSSPVRLRNISATGALIDSVRPLPEGVELMLDLAEAGTISATVTWSIGEQTGLRFAAPFDLARLAKAKPEVAQPHWEQPSYLKEAGRAAPWADEWERLSLPELQEQLEGYLKR